jgi:2-polyprenyl-3-methyl-5-hydroxy-6-metoxy-1,4-benzoquinol methylase
MSEWPPDELEVLDACPVCGDKARTVIEDGLEDLAFRSAPGRWKMHRCAGCHVAYLDPRPSVASIGRAYANYYTHEAPWAEPAAAVAPSIKQKLQNDYLNRQYGHDFRPALPFGPLWMLLRPATRRRVDLRLRHMPAPRTPGAMLLDLGCGGGAFLKVAEGLGYTAVGLEPDPAAVKVGTDQGLDIREGLMPGSGLPPDTFDQITMSHVLEHLHDPRAALAEAFALLRPGGRIWLSQPNLNALGRRRYGASWRGYEAPRHLSLYAQDALLKLLASLGFVRGKTMPAELAAEFYFRQSVAMSRGVDPNGPDAPSELTGDDLKAAQDANRAALRDADVAESLTVVAWKPEARRPKENRRRLQAPPAS